MNLIKELEGESKKKLYELLINELLKLIITIHFNGLG
jgi:hypothetical protein